MDSNYNEKTSDSKNLDKIIWISELNFCKQRFTHLKLQDNNISTSCGLFNTEFWFISKSLITHITIYIFNVFFFLNHNLFYLTMIIIIFSLHSYMESNILN